MIETLAIIGLVAFAIQFSMTIALRISDVKKDPGIVLAAGFISECAFIVLAIAVLF